MIRKRAVFAKDSVTYVGDRADARRKSRWHDACMHAFIEQDNTDRSTDWLHAKCISGPPLTKSRTSVKVLYHS